MPLINDQIKDILKLFPELFSPQMETETNLIRPNLAHHPVDGKGLNFLRFPDRFLFTL